MANLFLTLNKKIKKRKYKNKSSPFMEFLKRLRLPLVAILMGRILLFDSFNPLAFAFLALFFLEGTEFYIVAACLNIGFLSAGGNIFLFRFLLIMAVFAVMNIILSSRMKKLTLKQKAILASVSTAFGGVIYAIIDGFSMYLLFISFLEAFSVLFVSIGIKKGVDLLKTSHIRKIINTEEFLALMFILSLAACGLWNIGIWGIQLGLVLIGTIILFSAYKGGLSVGAATGVIIGSTLYLCKFIGANEFLMFSVAGIICGCLNKYGKLLVSTAFFAVVILFSFYFTDINTMFGILKSFVLSFLLFLAIPQNFCEYANNVSHEDEVFENYIYKIRSVSNQKLKGFANAFGELSDTIEKSIKDTYKISKSNVTENSINRICNKCELKQKCNKNEINKNIITEYKKTGDDKYLNKHCKKNTELKETIDNEIKIESQNTFWENKLKETREIFIKQLSQVSKILSEIDNEINYNTSFDTECENRIKASFDREKIDVSELIVFKNAKMSYEIIIKTEASNDNGNFHRKIKKVIEEILKRKFTIRDKSYDKDYVTITFTEEYNYFVATGVAFAIAQKNSESGDTYSIINTDNGNTILALCDGMGVGEKAREKSKTTIELFEKFTECGYNNDVSLEIINSMLVVSDNDETFSTLDICSINNYTGKAEFIKIGSAESFIVHNKNIEVLKSYSLPVGIIKTMDKEIYERNLSDGDYIIMITDGICDSMNKKIKPKDFIKEIIDNFYSNNPKDMADYILNEAKKRGENESKDDMTVLCARVWTK